MSQVSENRTVTPNEARSRLLRAFKVKRPVFLWKDKLLMSQKMWW